MKYQKQHILFFGILSLVITCLIAACTPKTTEKATSTPEEPVTEGVISLEEEGLSPCGKFSDATSPDQAETAHVLYRDFLKNKKYDEAFQYWQKAYELAPAADGKRDYHFLDGIKLYEQRISATTDAEERETYIQSIFELYNEATRCYPDRTTMYKGLKAFKLYYSYRDQATDLEIYQLFKEVIDEDGKETADFVVNPFTALMIDLYLEEKIPFVEAQKHTTSLFEIVDYGASNCEGANACERWEIVKSYAPLRLEELEGVEGFYDCAYYKSKYLAELEANPEDCEVIGTVYGRLKWGKCPETDALLTSLKPKIETCFPPEPPSSPIVLCKNYLQEGNYSQAVECYEEKALNSDDNEKKALYYLTIAKIYYGPLKKFYLARKYAQMALDNKPSWGAVHILIGKLYASSGPLCGPGRGFDSQRVVWVAIDEWNKAKNDPESAAEAKRLIAKYQQYMPTREDVFLRGLTVGGTYKVPCWINQNTTIRTAD